MLDAIVIAGSRNDGPLRECSDQAYEAMIRIGDKPMVKYVVEALLESGVIGKIAVAGSRVLTEVFPQPPVEVVEAESRIIDNAVKALAYVDNSRPVLIATCDIPLLTSGVVREFIGLCEGVKGDFLYPIIPMNVVNKRFPGIKRTSVQLKEGAFTGGNMFILNPHVVPRSAAKAQEFVNFRKSPVKLCRLLGLKFVLKLLFSRLSVPELEEKVSEVLGIKVKAVKSMAPEIGIDVDKASDYMIVSRHLTNLRDPA